MNLLVYFVILPADLVSVFQEYLVKDFILEEVVTTSCIGHRKNLILSIPVL